MHVGKAVNALIQAAGYRCYASVIPKDVTGDAIVYHVISDVPLTSKDGTSCVDTYRIQINCYSPTYSGVCELANNVRSGIDRKKGSFGNLTVDQVTFIDQTTDYNLEENEHEVRMDFYIKIKL